MKKETFVIIILSLVVLGYSFGLITSKYAHPSTEQCLQVCIEEFEKMGC